MLLTTGGDTVVTGVVEAISLLYTTVRTDLGVPVSIPNKASAPMFIPDKVQNTCAISSSTLCSLTLRLNGRVHLLPSLMYSQQRCTAASAQASLEAPQRRSPTVDHTEGRHRILIDTQAVAEMLVKNESRLRWSSTMLNFRAPRQLLLSFRLRLQARTRTLFRVSMTQHPCRGPLLCNMPCEPSLGVPGSWNPPSLWHIR